MLVVSGPILGPGCRQVPPLPAPPSTAAATTAGDPGEAQPDAADAPYFSGATALARTQILMDWPRGLGVPTRADSIEALAQMLEMGGATRIERQRLTAVDPGTGDTFALVNLFGHVRPEAPRRFVLATHFDTRPWADEDPDPRWHDRPVPGANDGTSGVAVVLELMPVLERSLPPDVGLTVILFDGEELGRPDHGGYCMGSRHFAREALEDPPWWLASAQLGIVLDMVGDRDLHIPIEPSSVRNASGLVDRLWSVAQRRGHPQFEPTHRSFGILDDHAFLTEAGVPSVLIIDREYDAWHTHRDTIDRVSAQSLAAVGDTVLFTLLELAALPSPLEP